MKLRRPRKNGKSNGAELKKAHSFKMLMCNKDCGREVKVDQQVESVQCWYCTAMRVAPPEVRTAPAKTTDSKDKKPRGYHLMQVFVDKEGNVFHRGVIQHTLQGSLPVTPTKPKKTRAEKDAIKSKKEERLAKLYKKKQLLKEKENVNISAAVQEQS